MKKLNLSKFKITNKGLYWGLIVTFAILYLCVGFVSTLHSITFFGLANTLGLAVLLGLTYEIGQASVLFSILMTKNKDKFLPWALMFLLTALQITANVYASFKFMATSGSTDWQYWQKSILIGVQATNAEMYQVIISWIAGALLPIVALGMTALVAQNIKLVEEEEEAKKVGSIPDEEVEEVINNEVEKKLQEFMGKMKTPVTDLEKPSEYIDLDESGIGGEPTPEEEQLISDFIHTNKEVERDLLDEEAERLTDLIPETTTREVNVQPSKIAIPEENIPEISDKLEVTISPEIENELVKAVINEITEPPKKKPGRPRKDQTKVVVPKKEKELLPNEKEDVEVPQNQKQNVNPLLLEPEKIEPAKSIEEVIKPSIGDEVIALLEKKEKDKIKDSITEQDKNEEMKRQASLVPPEILTPYLESGVEVIDAKAVPKPGVKKNRDGE